MVRLTDRPMTLDVYRGRKTTMQQQQQPPFLARLHKSRGNSSHHGAYVGIHVFHRISLVIRWSFSFQNSPENLDPSYKIDLESFGLFRKGKTRIMAKFQRTDSVVCCHSSEGETLY